MNKVEVAAVDIDLALFPVSKVAAALDIPPNTLRTWIQRGDIFLRESDQSAPAGGMRRLTFRRAMQIGLSAHLAAVGMPVERAAKIAASFTDMADPTFEGDRAPGELYAEGRTLLICYPGEDFGFVVSDQDIKRSIELFTKFAAAGRPIQTCAIVVDVSALWGRLAARLNELGAAAAAWQLSDMVFV